MGSQSSKAEAEPGSAEFKAEMQRLWRQRMNKNLRQQGAENTNTYNTQQKSECRSENLSPSRRNRPSAAGPQTPKRGRRKPSQHTSDSLVYGYSRSKSLLSEESGISSWMARMNPACWTATKTGSATQLDLDGLFPIPSLPGDLMQHVAMRLLPDMDISRRTRTGRQADTSLQGQLMHNLALAIPQTEIATLRLVCHAWCTAATHAVIDVPRCLTPEQALQPEGRWAVQARHIRSISVLVPYNDLLDRFVDPNVYQKSLEAKLRAHYTHLQEIHWQVEDVLRLVNERMSWVVTTAQPSWFLWSRGRDKYEFVDVPSMIRDSVICPDATGHDDVRISVECNGEKLPWEVSLRGPVTVQHLMDSVCAAGKEPADAAQRNRFARRLARTSMSVQDVQRQLEHATRWDVVPEHKYFQDLTLTGCVYNLSIGPEA